MNYLYPLIAVLIWGGNAVVTKASAGVISPVEICFYRWLAATVLMTAFIGPQLSRNWYAVRKKLGTLVLLGVLGGVGFPLLAYFAAQSTSAINIGIIQSLMPILALGLAVVLLGHRINYGEAAGGLISLTGVAVVVSHGSIAALFSRGPNVGDAMMLGATACYALYTVLLKRWQPGIPLPQSLYVQAAAATIALLPFYLTSAKVGIDAQNLPLVAYAGVLASIAAPLVWMHGIDRIGPARASLFFNLVPVVAAALAITLLSERLTASLALGGGLTAGGVLLAELAAARNRNHKKM